MVANKALSEKSQKVDMSETRKLLPYAIVQQEIRASDVKRDWIGALSDLFSLYDVWRGDANAPEQVAKYKWETPDTSERLLLTVSRKVPAITPFFRVTLDILPLNDPSSQRSLYASDFTVLTIEQNSNSEPEPRFVRFSTNIGNGKTECEMLLSPTGAYQMVGGGWQPKVPALS